jgi:hypothetical protein
LGVPVSGYNRGHVTWEVDHATGKGFDEPGNHSHIA